LSVVRCSQVGGAIEAHVGKQMSIFGGFARRPHVNGLSLWVAPTEVYVKRC
jgi:hypothetical protein